MLTIRLFASLRERLGTGVVELPWDETLTSVSDVLARLAQKHGEEWQILREEQLLIALNQDIVPPTTAVHDGDEVAFLPPVTGG